MWLGLGYRAVLKVFVEKAYFICLNCIFPQIPTIEVFSKNALFTLCVKSSIVNKYTFFMTIINLGYFFEADTDYGSLKLLSP